MLDRIDVTGAAKRAARLKLAYIPDERATGIVPELSVATNASLLRLPERAFQRAGLRVPRARNSAMARRSAAAFRFGRLRRASAP